MFLATEAKVAKVQYQESPCDICGGHSVPGQVSLLVRQFLAHSYHSNIATCSFLIRGSYLMPIWGRSTKNSVCVTNRLSVQQRMVNRLTVWSAIYSYFESCQWAMLQNRPIEFVRICCCTYFSYMVGLRATLRVFISFIDIVFSMWF
jgi:hypothetical protein